MNPTTPESLLALLRGDGWAGDPMRVQVGRLVEQVPVGMPYSHHRVTRSQFQLTIDGVTCEPRRDEMIVEERDDGTPLVRITVRPQSFSPRTS